MIHSKVCFKCNVRKPLEDFYKHSEMADGHINKCKKCTLNDVHKHRQENIEKIREYDRVRGKLPKRVKLSLETTRERRKKDSRYTKCHNAVARALRKGILIMKNCEKCGSEKSIAHHESYDRPLDVVWYCQPCHKERHKQMKKEGVNP
jgi:hypothetical protein